MIEQQRLKVTARGITLHMIIVGVAVLVIAVAGAFELFARTQRMAPSQASAAAAPENERVVFAVEGMHCGGCASGIQSMLRRTEGVISADVSYERREAVVVFDPARTSREKIMEAITNLGYKASVKS